MKIPFRPLGKVIEIVECMGLEVTYAYDDLVFVSHNAFLLQMDDTGESLFLFFNEESDISKRDEIAEQLTHHSAERSLNLYEQGTYVMKPNDNETLDVHFKPMSELEP